MADPISIEQLQNASADAQSLETFVNGPETGTVTTRLSQTYPTTAKLVKDIQSAYTTAETNRENEFQQAQADLFAARDAVLNASLPARVEERFIEGTNFTGNSTTAITTAHDFGSKQNLEIYFGGIFQNTAVNVSSYSNKVITFSSPIPAGIGEITVAGNGVNLVITPADGTVTDSKISASSKLKNRVSNHVDVKDYGSTITAGVISQAVLDLQSLGGGTLEFTKGTSNSVTLPSNLNAINLEYDGPFTPVNAYGELNSPATGQAYKTFRSADNSAHTGKEGYGVFIDSHPVGSGDGSVPGSDFALGISAIKQGWATGTTQQGQLCGVNIVTRSGYNGATVSNDYSPGDTSGIIVNTVQGSTACYTSTLESFAAYYLNGNVNAPDQNAMGIQLTPIRKDQGIAEGVVVISRGGANHNGLLVQAAGGTWDSVVSYIGTVGKTFDIPISGQVPRVRLFDGNGGAKSLRVASNKFGILSANEQNELFTVDDSGNVNAAGNYSIGLTRIIGPRVLGYGIPTGNNKIANFPGASATLAQTSAMLAALIVDLKAHGLLGE